MAEDLPVRASPQGSAAGCKPNPRPPASTRPQSASRMFPKLTPGSGASSGERVSSPGAVAGRRALRTARACVGEVGAADRGATLGARKRLTARAARQGRAVRSPCSRGAPRSGRPPLLPRWGSKPLIPPSAAPLLLLLPPPAAALWGPATTGSSIAESRCCRRCRCCWGGCCRTRGHLRGMRIPSDQAADRLVLPRRCRCRCRRRWPCCGARLGCCAAAAPLACRAGAARCGVPEGIGSPLGATLPQHRGTVLVPGALSPRCSSRQVLAEEWCRA